MIVLHDPSLTISILRPDIRSLVAQRFTEVGEFNAIVVEPGDSVDALEQEVGIPILHNLASGHRQDKLGGFKLTALIETSPGNHQGLIVFAEPITDAAVATRLLNALIAATPPALPALPPSAGPAAGDGSAAGVAGTDDAF